MMAKSDDYRRQQDLIFQELEVKAILQRQGIERTEVLVEELAEILMDKRQFEGKPIPKDQARKWARRALED